jgi:hypothetical protein
VGDGENHRIIAVHKILTTNDRSFSFIDPLLSSPICWLWKGILVLGVVPDVSRA